MPAPCTLAVAGHVCLDIIPTFTRTADSLAELLVPGKLVDVGPAVLATGGAVANTGLALHRLGMPTRLMGKVGDDAFGHAVLEVFRAHSPELASGMIVDPAVATSYTVVINPPGIDRVFLHCPGANDTYGADDVALDRLGDAGIFHFGYPPLMQRMYMDGGGELTRLLTRVRGRGITTSLDMALPDPASPAGQADWLAILTKALPQVDVFVPSLDELVYMLDRDRFDRMQSEARRGVPLGGITPAEVLTLADRTIGLGAAIVLIKLGKYGAYVRATDSLARLRACGRAAPPDCAAWRGCQLYAPCFSVRVAGTTGAGDCTIAGFLAGLAQGLGPAECLRWAVATGSASVEQPDATSGVPPREVLAARLAAGWPRDPAPPDFQAPGIRHV